MSRERVGGRTWSFLRLSLLVALGAEIFCHSFGLGCVACTAAASTAAVSAIAACEFSGACCPKTCGAGSFPLHPPSCCFGQETCLDNAGQCCRRDQQACAGKQCCNQGQTCLAGGPMKGTCCPNQAVRGASSTAPACGRSAYVPFTLLIEVYPGVWRQVLPERRRCLYERQMLPSKGRLWRHLLRSG